MFRVDQVGEQNGFTLTLENGYEVSVAWGPGHYCTGNRSAEVAVYDQDGVEVKMEGWQHVEDLPRWIAEAQKGKDGDYSFTNKVKTQ